MNKTPSIFDEIYKKKRTKTLIETVDLTANAYKKKSDKTYKEMRDAAARRLKKREKDGQYIAGSIKGIKDRIQWRKRDLAKATGQRKRDIEHQIYLLEQRLAKLLRVKKFL